MAYAAYDMRQRVFTTLITTFQLNELQNFIKF